VELALPVIEHLDEAAKATVVAEIRALWLLIPPGDPVPYSAFQNLVPTAAGMPRSRQ
jgi:hypothetical protein